MDTNTTLLDIFKRIQALAENPHWTADRRWTIGELAGKGMSVLATAKMERQLQTELDAAKKDDPKLTTLFKCVSCKIEQASATTRSTGQYWCEHCQSWQQIQYVSMEEQS